MNKDQPAITEIMDDEENIVYERHTVLHDGNQLYCKNCKTEGRGSSVGYRLFMFYPLYEGAKITANYNTYCSLKCYKEQNKTKRKKQ